MYEPLIEHIDSLIETRPGAQAEMKRTGPIYISRRIVAVLLDDLLTSFATAFIFISLLMIVLLKDLKLGIVKMVPNLFPIALVLGFMGLTDIPIDLNNLLLASIAQGSRMIPFTFSIIFKVPIGRPEIEVGLAAAKLHAGRACRPHLSF